MHFERPLLRAQSTVLQFSSEQVGAEDEFTSRIGTGGLLNSDKINLVGVILENIETFAKHYRQRMAAYQNEQDKLQLDMAGGEPAPCAVGIKSIVTKTTSVTENCK